MFQTLGTKSKLLDLLYRYRSDHPEIDALYPLDSFLPLSFRIDILDEFIQFINLPTSEGDIWIVKPEKSNQGRGI